MLLSARVVLLCVWNSSITQASSLESSVPLVQADFTVYPGTPCERIPSRLQSTGLVKTYPLVQQLYFSIDLCFCLKKGQHQTLRLLLTELARTKD